MVAGLVVVAAVWLRLLNFPLERDESKYAYAGQLMLQGSPPYQLAYNLKFPGTYLLVYHITNAVTLDPTTNPVSPMENMPSAIATGWRSAVQTNSP